MTSLLAVLAIGLAAVQEPAEVRAFEPQGFVTSVTVEIAAPVAEVFDAATGDVTGWWDHSFSENPAEMVIEPRFGGRFYGKR